MYIFFIFLIGCAIGSFINVFEARLYKNEDVFKKPSHCDFCGKKLQWLDMIPILSWIIYGGKSRCCRKRLSAQYPIVELAVGLSFTLLFMLARFHASQITNYIQNSVSGQFNFFAPFFLADLGWIIFIVFYSLIFVFAFTVFLQDLKYQAIHSFLLYVLIAVTFAYIIVLEAIGGAKNFPLELITRLLIGFIAALPFYLLYKISREKWLGEGDIWIVFWMGLFLGIPRVFNALYFGLIFGGVISGIVVLLKIKKMRDTISLGPFLLTGVLMSLLF